MFFAKGILERAHLRSLLTQSLHRGHAHALGLDGKHAATANGLIVQEDRACAANAMLATHMGASERQGVSQKVHQCGSRFNITLMVHAVDGDGKGQFVVHGWAWKGF
jgi:hypothetical protein